MPHVASLASSGGTNDDRRPLGLRPGRAAGPGRCAQPSRWCDRSKCFVERECDGSLTGFHLSAEIAAAETNGWRAADILVSLEQWCTATTPTLQVTVCTEDGDGRAVIPVPVADVAPVITALTSGAEALG